jgi:cytochrome b561
MIKDNKEALSPISIGLHWSLAIAFIVMLTLGLWMTSLDPSDDKWALYGLHKSIGFLLLFAATLRFSWRFYNKLPKPRSSKAWQQKASRKVHWTMLGLTLMLPVSGLGMSYFSGYPMAVFGQPIWGKTAPISTEMATFFNEFHGLASYALLGLVVLHVLAVLKHSLIDKDGTLGRMLGVKISS